MQFQNGAVAALNDVSTALKNHALAAAKLLYSFSHLDTDLVIDEGQGKAVLKLTGAATFVRLPKLATSLESVPPSSELHVDFQHLDYIDHSCLDLLVNWAKQHESTNGRLIIDWESLHARFRAEKGDTHLRSTSAATSDNGKSNAKQEK